MFKKLFLSFTASLICLSNISAQYNKAEFYFLNTQFKVKMIGDAFVGTRADGKANTYGLPSVKDFLKKFKSTDKSMPLATFTFVNTGATTIYDLCSNGSPVEVWQDPNNLNYIHAAFVTNPAGDPAFANRRSKYYFSTDKGATWIYTGDVPMVRSGFPAISGFSDGTALIVNHSADGGGTTRAQAYKDAFAGLGSFTRLDAPGNNGYIWPRTISTGSTILTNKFLMMASFNGADSTRYNICTNFNSTPGTWLGWTTVSSDVAETFALGRGTDGRIGIVFKNNDTPLPGSYADVWFIESTNDGSTFSTPLKIFDANFGAGGDSLGMLRGISITYKGNNPAVVFETIKQTQEGSFFPAAPAKIRFWSTTLPGVDPNRSIVIADSNNVGFHPYIGVNDVMASICRPNIGVSSDGTVLFAAFLVPSIYVGGTADSASFMDIWFTLSTNGGSNWVSPQKVNPVSPVKDWRYVSVSPVNDRVGSVFYCNMIALRGHIPGSYINGVGNGESLEEYWSIRASVNVGSIPPVPPALMMPANNSTFVTLTPLMDWTDVSGATSYNLQVSLNSFFTTTVLNLTNLTASQYQVTSGILQQNTMYYWRVSSTNGVGTGDWSGIYNFSTAFVPVAPILISPANGSTVITLTPTLDWSDEPSATSYSVIVATDTGFTNTVINTGTANSQYIVPSGLLSGNTTYYWKARAVNSIGNGPWSTRWHFTVNPTGVNRYSTEIPDEFKLYNNFPNPFNPSTVIRFDIPVNSEVKISVYDISGRIISQPANGFFSAGRYEINFNANNLSSGVYFYRIEANSFTDVKRMLLVK